MFFFGWAACSHLPAGSCKAADAAGGGGREGPRVQQGALRRVRRHRPVGGPARAVQGDLARVLQGRPQRGHSLPHLRVPQVFLIWDGFGC